MVYSGPPPWRSLNAALGWVFGGLTAWFFAFAMGGNDPTTFWVIILGLALILGGGTCIALLFWDEFVVVVVDIKERMLGQRRSRYDEYR